MCINLADAPLLSSVILGRRAMNSHLEPSVWYYSPISRTAIRSVFRAAERLQVLPPDPEMTEEGLRWRGVGDKGIVAHGVGGTDAM